MITGIDLFDGLEKISLSDFGQEFHAFSASAIRLETLPAYDVTFEVDDFQAFQRGQLEPNAGFNKEWRETLNKARNRGAIVRRLRVVPRKATDYLRFEIMWGYKPSSQCGESYLFSYDDEFQTDVGDDVRLDFWLFDSSKIYVMFYDYNGKFLGAARGNDAVLRWGKTLINKFSGTRDLNWALITYAVHA